MIVTLSLNRHLHVETGTVIRTFADQPVPRVEFARMARLIGHDATQALAALDEILRRQDAATNELRFGLAQPQPANSTVELLDGEERSEPALTMTDVGPFPRPSQAVCRCPDCD